MSCELEESVVFDCDNLQQGGIANAIYGINYTHWKTATVTLDGTSKEITNITLTEVGAKAIKIQVPKSSNIIATSVLRAIDGVDGFDDQLDMRIANIEQVVINNLAKNRFNKMVWIVELLDGRKKIYGGRVNDTPEPIGVGTRISDWQDNQGDASVGGTVQIVTRTPENDPPEVLPSQLIASTFDPETLLTPVP
jgi:hypothetical protein